MNKILDFYREHKISPVHQDIQDFNYHCRRREKLYRQLGMPTQLFRNADVLEVGTGGGVQFDSVSTMELSSEYGGA